MKIVVVLYLDDNIEDSDLSLCGSFIPQILATRFSSLPSIENIYYSVPELYQGKITSFENVVIRKRNDDVEFWKNIFKDSKADHLVRIFTDSPFIDQNVIEEMITAHIEYLAEFTYSENLPAGLSCEIISKDLITELPDFEEKTLPLSSIIKSNINQFDIELFYKEPDLRDKRISFRTALKRDAKIMDELYNLNNQEYPEYGKIKQLIEENPQALYIGPAYLEIELSGACELDCIFCYRNKLKQQHGDMTIDLFKKIISDMQIFNLPYTVCFGGSGEPLMNNNFYQILEYVTKQKLLSNIIIETNGIYLDNNFIHTVSNYDLSKMTIIININGLDQLTYQTMHGADYFEVIFKNIQALHKTEQFTGKLYLQVMKIKETEQFLDKYYNFWENYSIPIILQKQNTYLGLIEDRRYSDLTPLDRVPCWHLQRDLYILADGTVTFCKQDVEGTQAAGLITEQSILDIWNSNKNTYMHDFKKEYSRNPDCKSCDEWYTYNF